LDMEFVELLRVYRQQDETFLNILGAIRNGTATEEDLAVINGRVNPSFIPPGDEHYICLTSTNDLADRINAAGLERLPGRPWVSHGVIAGDFGREFLPTAVELKLKKGAQVMLLNNDAKGRWVNGTVGRVMGFTNDGDGEVIIARLETGDEVEIAPYRWEIYRFYLDNNELASEVVGSFTQYPVRLAFAVTIHKSQGKTFAKVVIDLGRGTFAPGQLYVALSRCRSLEGIVLRQPVKRHHLLMDGQVVRFLTRYQYLKAAQTCPLPERLRIIQGAIASDRTIEIVYLKAKDEKSRRTVKPLAVGAMEYNGHPFIGMEALCLLRGEKRVFNVARIIAIIATL
ncbi:MAG: WYL domain-containing protein, partial [Syntrophales bacterium]|nr:WYL domain-containing protein [Syntrophales bacterium]